MDLEREMERNPGWSGTREREYVEEDSFTIDFTLAFTNYNKSP